MDVHAMALAAGKGPQIHHKVRSGRHSNKVTVTLQWVEIEEPNTCEFTFERFAPKSTHGEDYARHKHIAMVGTNALTAMKSRLVTARTGTKHAGCASGGNSKLVLCDPIAGCGRDNSIHSLHTLSTDNAAAATQQVHRVQLQVDKVDREARAEKATLTHDSRCIEWIKQAEYAIMYSVLRRPEEYSFDDKTNSFVHKHNARVRLETHTSIETPLVDKRRYPVCIDGYKLLLARQAVAESQQGGGCDV